jgi:hypothetical protein
VRARKEYLLRGFLRQNVSRETSLLCQFSSVERNAKGCRGEPVQFSMNSDCNENSAVQVENFSGTAGIV